MAHSYFDYYHKAIIQETNGLKLILGGTGLGKTSAIVDVVEQEKTPRRYIYCANRIQLLEEMSEHLSLRSIGHIHLRNDTDVIVDILKDPVSDQSFQELLQHPKIQRYVEHIYKSTGVLLSIPNVLEAYEAIRATSTLKSNPLLAQLIGIQASRVMRFFKSILIASATIGVKSKGALSQRDHVWFLKNPTVQQLFPYVTFKQNLDIKILLVTIQKAFFGFFDGRQSVSLSNFQDDNGNYIFFLDEFDFLESDLIELICQDVTISEPFKFVQYFYEAMHQNKLPLSEYPVDSETRERIEAIVSLVSDLPSEYDINFPRLNHFTCTHLQDIKNLLPHIPLQPTRPNKDEGGISIFQTNRTIANVPIYLRETERAFDIVTERTKLSAFVLFNTVYWATHQTLYMFRELETRNSILRAEVMRHCFETTTFRRAIDQIRQLPPKSRQQPTQFSKLLDSGYGLYEIQDLQQESDRDEVKLRHYSIHTTPERILRNLASNNLVFGLSATADIPRCVRNFSEGWLREQDFTFFEITSSDAEAIAELNAQKQACRDNQIEVTLAKPLGDKELLDFIRAISSDEIFGDSDTTRRYRTRRVKHFFETLLWIVHNRDAEALQTDSHVLFFNSFKHIEYVFRTYPVDEDGRFTVKSISLPSHNASRIFNYYEFRFEETTFIVIFYDAAKAREIESEEQVKREYYKLFWRGLPVLLVTTYPSAGNGINLQYYPDEESKNADEINHEHRRQTDFKCIHLLDSPYFYFDRTEPTKTIQENDTSIKKNVWYMAKLYTAKIITEGQFKSFLSNIRERNLNAWYLQHTSPTYPDAILNQLATFIQAIGRIERVWSSMEDQVIRLDQEVYDVFEVYCTDSRYIPLREQRVSTISNNLNSIFTQVVRMAKRRGREVERYTDERLPETNQKCRQGIGNLLAKLDEFRQHVHSPRAQNAKADWHALRIAVLRHDFHNPILHKYHCLFETSYYHDGTLYIGENLELVPHTHRNSDSHHPWRLDSVYRVVSKNPITRRFFETRGYELGFNNTTGQFFTPYCYQSILSGAVGEAGIAAIFEGEKIDLAENEIPDVLFEIVDTKVATRPWYIDCKNYRERTLQSFSLKFDDPDWHPHLNDAYFQLRAQTKLQTIIEQTKDESCKLIYIVLTATDNWTRRYFDSQFNDVGDDFQEAQIIVIPGVLNIIDPLSYCQCFEVFLSHIKETLLL